MTHGFELLNDSVITEINTRALLYRHVQTGAQLLSLINDDENKVFGITFPTPPADSTGLPHILEHSVLGGSRKYPLKEPFVQLLKASLNTYLNASTYPDKTAYPVASTNLKDFYNLVDVYLDAVLHPLITPHHLDQEGWHYELDDVNAPLAFKGVVFNEMKGAYSSPDNMMYRYCKESLFPDTIYRYDSGGDPTVIPQLTYEQFKNFHATYYHPSNAYLYFYGDDDPEDRLRRLDAVLREFQPRPLSGGANGSVDQMIPLQPRFSAPSRLVKQYGVDADGDHSNKTLIRLNWLLPEANNPALDMGLSILSYAIIGAQASPLRKTLVDSGLGEDVNGGYSSGLRQVTFAVGMKNIASADADKVEALILETLAKLEAEGIESEMVEAALNSMEFSLRENNTGSYPRGLAVMFGALGTWLYGQNPLDGIRYEAPLSALKEKLATDPRYLQDLIRQHLLDNGHRTTVILEPDPDFNQRLIAEEQERLQQAQAAMQPEALQAIVENTKTLKARQALVDTPEELACLPTLTLADLDKKNKLIPLAVSSLQGAKVLYHDLFTNGILYLNIGWNLQAVPAHLLPYVRLFGQSLTEMGTEKEDYVKLNQRIMRKTGGVYFSTMLSSMRKNADGTAWFFLNGKSTVPQTADMLDIMRDVLLTVKLDNPERFRQIVLKNKARIESGLAPSGHSVVDGRLRSSFSAITWAGEEMSGLPYLFFLRSLAEMIEKDWGSVLNNLKQVRNHLLNRSAMICNVTLDAANWAIVEPQLATFLTTIPAYPLALQPWMPDSLPAHEGLTMPVQVNYVGKGANLYNLGYRYHGSVNVITNFIRTGYLWDRVRVQGGAYGGFCRFNKQSGVFSYLSYRDPNLINTLDIYDQTAEYLRSVEIDNDELTRNIIGAIGDFDGYMLPDAKGAASMTRYLLNESEEDAQQARDEVLSATVADFRAFAEVLAAVREQGRVVVMGSQDAIEKANAQKGNWLAVTKVL